MITRIANPGHMLSSIPKTISFTWRQRKPIVAHIIKLNFNVTMNTKSLVYFEIKLKINMC